VTVSAVVDLAADSAAADSAAAEAAEVGKQLNHNKKSSLKRLLLFLNYF